MSKKATFVIAAKILYHKIVKFTTFIILCFKLVQIEYYIKLCYNYF